MVSIYLSISMSALAYSAPLLIPTYAWWCVFLFSAPLYLLPYLKKPTFSDGLLWGILVFSCTLSGVFMGALYNTHSTLDSAISAILAIMIAISLILYFSLYSALWFWLTGELIQVSMAIYSISTTDTVSIKKLVYSNTSYHMLLISIPMWLATTLLYIFCIDNYSLWPFLRLEGHPLMHPLIPLATHPKLLRLLPLLGKNMLTFLVLLPAAALALGLTHYIKNCRRSHQVRKHYYLQDSHIYYIFFLLTLASWTGSYLVPQRTRPLPDWLAYISWLPLQGSGHETVAYIAQNQFKKIITTKPSTRLIIVPESAFYSDTLCSTDSCMQLWHANYLTQPISIICGSFSRETTHKSCKTSNPINQTVHEKNKSYLFNTCYLVYNGSLFQEFHKTHTVPFTEQMPLWLTYPTLNSLFFTDFPAITPSTNKRMPFMVPGVHTFIPYICSELFFSHYPDSNTKKTPILALVNDAWTHNNYLCTLMLRTAQLKAIEWQCDILYISYAYGVSIDKNGICHTI
ncbi:MAG: hypothetical protein NT124_02230 [Candidatus Dependentiae bacterium]|nr:hypothetical protein [Candidatus Dependentiae bacterium]